MTNHSFWYYYFVFFGMTLIRYFLIAGGAYLLFYLVLKKFLTKRSLRLKPPMSSSIRNDIQSSVLSAVIFAFCAALIIQEYGLGITLLYTEPYKYGLWYLGVSFVAVLILQDTYFYFLHRIFHHPLVFKWIHHGHHSSGEPTPLSSFAFDLLEAIVQALFFLVVIFIVPIHFITLGVVLMTMTVWSVVSHLGFEISSASSPHHWLKKWFIGSKHHWLHHRKYTVHYGLYFTFWDRLLGTQDPNFD
jgi:sterol desaturase/sphingolipid hydroxylase (fatty acid hydroxylase superfamily)